MGDEFGALVKSFERFQAEQQESPQKTIIWRSGKPMVVGKNQEELAHSIPIFCGWGWK